MPPAKKRADRRQRRNKTPELRVIPGAKDRLAELAKTYPGDGRSLLKSTRARWHAYLESDVALAVDAASDWPALERLFLMYDERERYRRELHKRPLVEGSMGQPVSHPFESAVASLDSRIKDLEDRFGLSPKARAQLGVEVGAAQRSLDEMNARIAREEPDDDDGLDEDDPRLDNVIDVKARTSTSKRR